MKQYCRYCVELCVNNVPYCQAHEKCLSGSYCKHPNNCKDFVTAWMPLPKPYESQERSGKE